MNNNFHYIILGKPSLVRETSRFSLLEAARHPILTLKEIKTKKSSALKDVILPPKLESRLGYVKYISIQCLNVLIKSKFYFIIILIFVVLYQL